MHQKWTPYLASHVSNHIRSWETCRHLRTDYENSTRSLPQCSLSFHCTCAVPSFLLLSSCSHPWCGGLCQVVCMWSDRSVPHITEIMFMISFVGQTNRWVECWQTMAVMWYFLSLIAAETKIWLLECREYCFQLDLSSTRWGLTSQIYIFFNVSNLDSGAEFKSHNIFSLQQKLSRLSNNLLYFDLLK